MQGISRANKNQQAILNGLASAGQRVVAKEIGLDETQLSKWKANGEIVRMAKFLAACGLKVVNQDMECFNKKAVACLLWQAQQYMNGLKGADDLLPWGEDPE